MPKLEALRTEYQVFGGQGGRESRYRLAVNAKRQQAVKYVWSKIKEVAKGTDLEIEWSGESSHLDNMHISSNYIEVGRQVLGKLVHDAAQAQLRDFKPALKIADSGLFSFHEPATGTADFSAWLVGELEKKKAFAARDAQAWILFKSLKERARYAGIDTKLKSFLAAEMVRRGVTYTDELLNKILMVAELESATGIAQPDDLSANLSIRKANAVSNFVKARTAPGALQSFANLQAEEFPFLSEEWRAEVDAETKKQILPAAQSAILSLLQSCLEVDPDAPFSLSRLFKPENELPGPAEIAAALPPSLSVLFPAELEPNWISSALVAALRAAAKAVVANRVGAELGRSESQLPSALLDFALGLTPVAAFLDWIRSLFPQNQDFVSLLDGAETWLDDLLLSDLAQKERHMAEAAYNTHGFPLPAPNENGYKGRATQRIRNAVTIVANEDVEKAVAALAETKEFRDPKDLLWPGIEAIRPLLLLKVSLDNNEAELKAAWDKAVAEKVFRELDSSCAHMIDWFCLSLRTMELERPEIASAMANFQSTQIFKELRNLVYRFGLKYEDAVNNAVASASLDSLRSFRRAPESLLTKLGLPIGCRKLDHKWRETVARRFYRDAQYRTTSLAGFEDVFTELGITGQADSSCSCGFYRSRMAPKEFLLRNHWCLRGEIRSFRW